MKDRIAAYMAQGYKAVQVASIVGCDASTISKLENDTNDVEYIELKKKEVERLEKQKEAEDQEKAYTRLENVLMSHMEEQLPFAEFRDVTAAMKMLIDRKAKPNPHILINNTTQNNHVAFLNLPTSVIPHEVVLNSQKEIVGIGKKSLAPMPNVAVRSLFDALKNDKKNKEIEELVPVDISTIKEVPEDF